MSSECESSARMCESMMTHWTHDLMNPALDPPRHSWNLWLSILLKRKLACCIVLWDVATYKSTWIQHVKLVTVVTILLHSVIIQCQVSKFDNYLFCWTQTNSHSSLSICVLCDSVSNNQFTFCWHLIHTCDIPHTALFTPILMKTLECDCEALNLVWYHYENRFQFHNVKHIISLTLGQGCIFYSNSKIFPPSFSPPSKSYLKIIEILPKKTR